MAIAMTSIGSISITAAAAMLLITGGYAAPSDDIARAVTAQGFAEVEKATPAVFARAFTSVLLRTKPRNFPDHVSSAIKLRPDLAPQITIAALRAYPRGRGDAADSCSWGDAIIRAAVTTAPSARDAIGAAAAKAQPELRDCIFASVGLSGMELAFYRREAVNSGFLASNRVGVLNPANLSNLGNTVSPNQLLISICDRGETAVLPQEAAEQYLEQHPTATRGTCR